MAKPSKLKDEFYTPDELASLLKVSIVSVRRWVREGRIPHYQIGDSGSTIRLARSDIEKFRRPRRKGRD